VKSEPALVLDSLLQHCGNHHSARSGADQKKKLKTNLLKKRAKQNKTKQNKTKQNKTKQNKTKQNKTN